MEYYILVLCHVLELFSFITEMLLCVSQRAFMHI